MRIGGAWVGLGLGDNSPKIADIKAFLKKKFAWVRAWQPALDDTGLYDATLAAVVAEMQRRYGLPATGIMNRDTQLRCGFLTAPPPAKPVFFTIEGHMSNMWNGPCAFVASTLEKEGLCRWQPVGYDTTSLPFNNKSGTDEFKRLLSDTTLLPPGTPWVKAIFSQGGIIGSSVWLDDILPESGSLHWRLKDWRGTLAFGNPYRERDVIAEWVPDPPKRGTQGISNRRLVGTHRYWKEHSRRGDLYAENEVSLAGRDKTAIYEAVQNQWSGDPDALLERVTQIVQKPLVELLPMVQAIVSGLMFVGNMAPHGSYDLSPCLSFMRARLTAAPEAK